MGNYIKDLVITYSGKESEKEFTYRCMCITESLCRTNETNTALLINCTSIKKKKCAFRKSLVYSKSQRSHVYAV